MRRGVSCCDGKRWCHAGWETIREQFPIEVEHDGVMQDRKPLANYFRYKKFKLTGDLHSRLCYNEHKCEKKNFFSARYK